MVDQLLWINVLAALFSGAMLVVAPTVLIRSLGLPKTEQSFYPRLQGVFLLGFAAAIIVEGNGASGLGIAGVAAINLITGLAIVILLLIGGLAMAKRGRWILRGIAAGLLLLGFFGLAAS